VEITNLSSEKAEFLRVIEKLEKQLMDYEKRLNAVTGGNNGNLSAGNTPNNARPIQKREPLSDNKLRSTRSEIIEPAS